MIFKTVVVPIEVPEGDYCKSSIIHTLVCQYFWEDDGQPTCEFCMYGHKEPEIDDKGVLKPKTCRELKRLSDLKDLEEEDIED